MPGGIGPLELVVVLVIVLLVFGPKRLPGLGKQLGGGMREFKESITGKDHEDEDDADARKRPALTPASPEAASSAHATPVPSAQAEPVAPAAAKDPERA